MTTEQLKQWNDYACIPRCIIKLTEMNGHSITRDDFCSRFEQLFSNPAKQYGLFPTHHIQSVLKPLSLPQKVSESGNYSTVEAALANKQLVLMFSHVDLKPRTHERTSPLQRANQDGRNRILYLDTLPERSRCPRELH